MDRLKAVEELAEKWANDNTTIILLGDSAQTTRDQVVKAFVGGFAMAMDLSKDTWDAGYEAGKAYGMTLAEVEEDA